jgi:hypothetical protein
MTTRLTAVNLNRITSSHNFCIPKIARTTCSYEHIDRQRAKSVYFVSCAKNVKTLKHVNFVLDRSDSFCVLSHRSARISGIKRYMRNTS